MSNLTDVSRLTPDILDEATDAHLRFVLTFVEAQGRDAAYLLERLAVIRPSIRVSTPTAAEIEAAKTKAGGWTRATLAGWGVSWPPPKGWRRRLEEQARAASAWSKPHAAATMTIST